MEPSGKTMVGTLRIPPFTLKDAHHEGSVEVSAQCLCYLRGSETLHKVEGRIPLFVPVTGNALVNHVGNFHIPPETGTPFFIKTLEKGCRSIACFDRFSGN